MDSDFGSLDSGNVKDIVNNLRLLNTLKIDLDFVAQFVSSRKIIFIDGKRMIDFGNLFNKKIGISDFTNHEILVFNMKEENIDQKPLLTCILVGYL